MPGDSGLSGLSGLSAIFGGCYADKVLRYGPIAYWPLWEAGGTVAQCLVSSAQGGTYTNAVLGQSGIGDGSCCPYFNGTTAFMTVGAAALSPRFNGSLGSAILWMKVANVGVWTDGLARDGYRFIGGGTDYLWLYKVANNTMRIRHRGNAMDSFVNFAGMVDTAFFFLGATWSVAANELRFYYNGVQQGAPGAGVTAWLGALSVGYVGSEDGGPTTPWFGWLAHCALFDKVLTPTQILDLYQVG